MKIKSLKKRRSRNFYMIIELIKNSDLDERGGKPGVKIFKNERKKLNFIFKLLQQIAAV